MSGTDGRAVFSLVNLSLGGAQRVVSRLADDLGDRPADLLLFEDAVDYGHDGEVTAIGAQVHARTKLGKLYALGKALWATALYKHVTRPDVMVSSMVWPNVVNGLTAGAEGTVLTVHSTMSRALDHEGANRRRIIGELIGWACRRADQVVCVSKGIARDLERQLGVASERLTTIYNPIAIEAVERTARAPLPAPYPVVFSGPTIVHVGTHRAAKGQWHLIRAFRRVHVARPEATLVLIGDGPMRGYLEELAVELGLTVWSEGCDGPPPGACDVAFTGYREDPHPFVARADLFCFPSIYEGFPVAVLEAQACRTPIVAADCASGPREILAPGTGVVGEIERPEWTDRGVLMPVCDGVERSADEALTDREAAWAETVESLLGPEAAGTRDRLAQFSRERVEDFALERITEQWEALMARYGRESS